MEKKYLFLFILSIFYFNHAFSQCPVAAFSMPDTVCEGIPISITNNSSSSAIQFNWDFANDSLFTDVTYTDMGNPSSLIVTSFSFGLVNEGNNWYGFMTNNSGVNNQTVRYDFGNDLNNPPATLSFGNLPGVSAIYCPPSFVKFNNKWYGFLASYNNKLIMLDFGFSLQNIPISTDLGNIGAFDNCYGINAQIDNGELIVMVINYGGSLSIMNFGNSVSNIPLVKKISNKLNSANPSDISIVKDCNNWYGLVVDNSSAGKIFTLDFGSSLFYSTAIVTEAGSIGSRGTRGNFIREGNHWYALVHGKTTNAIYVFDFNKNINNPNPQMRILNNPGINGTTESIFFTKTDSRIFSFTLPYTNPTLQKIIFSNPGGANILSSSSSNPGSVSYPKSGKYHITLQAIDSADNTSWSTKYITVLGNPVSNFTTSGGCTSMQFFDSSYVPGGGNINRWEWDFGDGTVSSLQNPMHTYADTGTYMVTLKNYNFMCSGMVSKTIRVHEVPLSHFSFNAGVCAGIPVAFQDASTIGSDQITSWKWDFGNGDSSLQQSPVYAFPSGGAFQVILTATSNMGCSDTAVAIATVNIKPVTAFNTYRTCIADTVHFLNASTISSGFISKTFWNFGDGKTSSNIDEQHPYATGGTYAVKLLSIANNGCKDSIMKNIKIAPKPAVSFSVTPSNVCTNNQAVFTDLSTSADPIIKWLWNFGTGNPGDTSILQNPVFNYAIPGNKTVALTAGIAPDCKATFNKSLTVVSDPHAAFTYTPVCKGTSVAFTDFSSAPAGIVVKWEWDFGDNTTSAQKNPLHMYADTGTYLVSLKITTNLGCTNSFTYPVTVYSKPLAAFSNTIICEGNAVSFQDQSSIGKGSIITWKWSFGDPASGNSNLSSIKNPSHTFLQAGAYTIKLIVTGNAGCKDSVSKTLTAFISPSIDFGYTPNCEGDYVSFTDLSIPAFPSTITSWNWSFGDGGSSSIQNPAHKYPVAFTYNATLNITSSNGCNATLTKPVIVNPYPQPNFSNSVFCLGAQGQLMDSSSISNGSIKSWLWTIDTLAQSQLQNPFYTFTDTGTYKITLKLISNASCSSTVSKYIHVYPLPIADFSFSPQFGKAPLSVQFTNVSKGASSYNWNMGGINFTSLPSPKYTFQDTGNYQIKLEAISLYGCKNTIVKDLSVRTPTLDLAVLKVFPVITKNSMKINAILGNLGNRMISSADLKVSLSGNSPVMEPMNIQIGPGKSFSYQFNSSFEIVGDLLPDYFCVEAENPNGETDDLSTNNSLCYAIKNEFIAFTPYPNPCRERMYLECIIPAADITILEIYDAIGRQMSQQTIAGIKGVNHFTVDTSTLEAGIYTVKITYGDKYQYFSFIKTAK